MSSRIMWRKLAIGLLAAGCLTAPAAAQIRLNDKGTTTSEPMAPPRSSAPADTPSAGSDDVVDGRDIEQLAAIMRELGYQAKVGQSSNGQPRISSAAGGINFSVTTYSCTGDSKSCSIDFFTFWRMNGKSMPLEKVNDWNREWRFLKAYNDKDGDLNLVFNIELTGGISKSAFTRNFQRWTSMLARFDKFRQE